jgi:hypothetical protein
VTWTTRADVAAKLRRRWESGEFLGAHAAGRPWEPIDLPLRGPKPREIGANFAAVKDWVGTWRGEIDSYQQLWTLLAVTSQVRRFTSLVERTRAVAPRLVDWMVSRPHTVLKLPDGTWSRIVDTILWIDGRDHERVYVRQVDVPGVDTKFIESNRSLIATLLDLQLDPSRVDPGGATFAARYGLLDKPRYVRFRWLDPNRTTAGFTELTVRVGELVPQRVARVFVLENETTYLAFPDIPDAVAIFGGGYSVTRLDGLAWLRDQPLIYWGDLDTHGFSILDMLRRQFPDVRSLLMDRATLLDHESQWVREDRPTTAHLPLLTGPESALYRDLVEDTFGTAIRLEQERVRYSAITAAVDDA